MADTDPSLYNLRYNQTSSNLEAFGGGSPQWTLITLNNVDPQQVPITRLINTTAPLQGGGNLSADRTLSITQATASTDGYLSSADWNTFNNKQAAGNYITALTGDATATGPGSVALTLATVNGNIGTFALASITVNAKGLITSASAGTTGSLTDTGTDGISITNGTGAVIGSGTSIAQHVADTTHNGYLSSTDWNTFNSKEPATLTNTHIFVGNASNVPADVALSGDATLANTGALTLATVNSNVGSFTNANITVDAKGRITAAATGTSSGITQLTGDVTAGPGSGSQAAILASVNSNIGSFTNASLTVNGKGLITAASSGTAPVTSVSGTTNQITSTGGATPVLAIANPVTFPGAMTAGGALAMASNKITGLANGTASTDAAAFGQILGFRILQVVQTTGAATASTTGTTFVASNITVSITPTLSTSRIFVMAMANVGAGTTSGTAVTIFRGTSTNLGNATSGMVEVGQFATATTNVEGLTMFAFDSPATTSATSYAVYFRSTVSGQTATCPPGTNTTLSPDLGSASIIAFEIG
jgi:hypothetical protein